MSENPRKHKNDYSVSVFGEDGFLVKLQYVHNVYDLARWLTASQKYSNWVYMNVYLRRSGEYLGRNYKGNFINPYP